MYNCQITKTNPSSNQRRLSFFVPWLHFFFNFQSHSKNSVFLEACKLNLGNSQTFWKMSRWKRIGEKWPIRAVLGGNTDSNLGHSVRGGSKDCGYKLSLPPATSICNLLATLSTSNSLLIVFHFCLYLYLYLYLYLCLYL